ncbi:NAD(P)/FAD-dependent oxidoreductase [Chitinasiproducens palmae]|uniref:3-phenylpropionate/trans-cinnamate dioxygenase ferredoxin reductase subunit n=1 Tax=Chitinasiproducens palmae TaxID=1770053 RepID=A0A1H2PLC9_9BURK|nr:FAD-dependent oxidoreductase [Chitinasiproducens palmae]SDV46822.1 3-phenylpropionate/trans-cinnamate dioxygenase ferredoxin reductase subunit [Chitinasiproducens palmae]
MSAAPRHIAIVGAGQAGLRCAETLRANGFDGRVTMIGDEPHLPYERPPLSKGVLAGHGDAGAIHLRARDAFGKEAAQLDVDLLLDREVTSLDATARRLTLRDGMRIDFDRCILATGGRARPWPNTARHGSIVTLRSLDDAYRLRERLRPGQRMLVIGAGFLGLECADAARGRGVAVTVVERGEQLLNGRLPSTVAAQLRGRHQANGIAFRFGATIANLAERANRTPGGANDANAASTPAVRLTLGSGEVLDGDFCLVATGQVPNDALAARAGLATADGIVVDGWCRTSSPHIFAAGDCARFPYGTPPRTVRLESWQNAEQQSRVAARNAMCADGQAVRYALLPWFWTDQAGWNIQMLGWRGPDEPPLTWVVRTATGSENERCVWFGLEDGVLVAAVAINSGADVAPLRTLIGARARFDATQWLDAGTRLAALSRALKS